jgi:hypothetical protein
MSSEVSRPVFAMLFGQVIIALLLFWVLPISKAAEVKNNDLQLSLGRNNSLLLPFNVT